MRPCLDKWLRKPLDHVLTPIRPKPNATEKNTRNTYEKGGCNVLLDDNIDIG